MELRLNNMAALSFLTMMVLNTAYLMCYYSLIRNLESNCTEYWKSIGAPTGFSGRDINSMLNELYRSRMSRACEDGSIYELLLVVRILFPIASLFAVLTLYWLTQWLEK
jgi:hypothetical protein